MTYTVFYCESEYFEKIKVDQNKELKKWNPFEGLLQLLVA